MKKIIPRINVLISILTLTVSIGLIFNSQEASAVSASDWRASRIMDDFVFRKENSMTVSEIQTFLNSKVPVCDTGGTKQSEYGSGTRAQYAATRGVSPPFVCLKDYSENGKSSAQIIKDASTTYHINPQVLITLLQKEQNLVGDDWPWPVQYRSATGYGCPDTAPCDTQYYGLTNQLNWAAKMFDSIIKQDPNWFTPYNPGTNFVKWNPQSSCGGSQVNIENEGTSALYNYTPYQPNQAALNNLYGSGDNCSSYGNRNYWRLFNDWFGYTLSDSCSPSEAATKAVSRLYNPKTFAHLYTNYVCESDIAIRLNGFKYENPVYYTSNPQLTGNIPLHRLYNPTSKSHFWTTTQADIDAATQYAGYRYEGVAYYVADPHAPGSIPVHRLYNPKTYLHIWATTQEDINAATQYAGYRYEGVAYYVGTQSW